MLEENSLSLSNKSDEREVNEGNKKFSVTDYFKNSSRKQSKIPDQQPTTFIQAPVRLFS